MKKITSLLRYLGNYKPQIALYFITNLLAIVFSLFSFGMLAPVLQVLFMGKERPKLSAHPDMLDKINYYVYNFILKEEPINALAIAVVIVVIFTILKNLFLYISVYILNPLRNMILRRLRDDLFTKTLSLPIGFFTEERKGDLISRMTNDINEVELSIMAVLEVFIREPLTIIITLGAMLFISWQLTLFFILFLPVPALIIGRLGKSLKRPSNEAQEQLGNILGVLDETIAGMRVVKAFNAEKNQHLKFTRINNTLFRVRNKIAARRELGSPLSETIGIAMVGIILWYGGKLIFSNNTSLTGPLFVVYIGLLYQIIAPFKNLSNANYSIKKGTAALDRIEHLMNVENTITEIPNAVPVKTFERSIEFRDVRFNYGDKKILDGINLTVAKGKMIALVGHRAQEKARWPT